MGEDGDGKVYLATATGVSVWNDGNSRSCSRTACRCAGLTRFFAIATERLWMGMLGPVCGCSRTGRSRPILIRDGLFDGEIYGIVADDQDRLWMACSKGIFSVPRGDLLRFAAGDIKKISSTPYSPTDALRVIECKPGVQPAAWRHARRAALVLHHSRTDRARPAAPAAQCAAAAGGD